MWFLKAHFNVFFKSNTYNIQLQNRTDSKFALKNIIFILVNRINFDQLNI